MKRALFLLLALMAMCERAPADLIGVGFRGEVFRLNELTGGGLLVGNTGELLNSLARNSQGHLYTINRLAEELLRIDPLTGTIVSSQTLNVPGQRIASLAFSPTDQLYGVLTFDSDPSQLKGQLLTIDVPTGQTSLLGSRQDLVIQALTFASDGTLYAWDVGASGNGDGHGLITMATDGTGFADVNPLVGTPGADIQSIEFTPDGTLYGGRSRLFTINKSTGVHTPVGAEMGWDIRGLAYVPPVPEPCSRALCLVAFSQYFRCKHACNSRRGT